MVKWERALIDHNSSIRDAIKKVDESALQIGLIVDEQRHLVGVLTDGDIRRGILRAVSLDEPVHTIMNPRPTFASSFDSREEILAVMKQKHLRHIPVLDNARKIIGLETLEELFLPKERDNWVVLMAGGLGTRLYPLTEECPKPLLKVGGKPLLESILEHLISFGFCKFYISVNYKADMVEEYFGRGEKWGVEIRYLRENKRLGTAGALSLIPEIPDEPLLVMNGDLLTKVNFKQLLDFHKENASMATMCVRDYEYQIPYGVVEVDKHKLIGIKEKPVHTYFVNAGIYVLEPNALKSIPKDSYFDMPGLFEMLMKNKQQTSAFPVREYWLDIGQMDDYKRANIEFMEVFG
ncbi:nucleotidyltransferase family protein [Paenibacillus thermotolerans]|uniref:nucleotidyltransferase family protein n=1 Tax=Paenibacillus thermotolerans TaxID=3027807 RepID=UPI00236795CE|nr:MULTISPECIES: nucleotidyltransferase family protein [unclassified Paenibacillus]